MKSPECQAEGKTEQMGIDKGRWLAKFKPHLIKEEDVIQILPQLLVLFCVLVLEKVLIL